MLKLFSAFRKNKIWDFNGGIHPEVDFTAAQAANKYR